MNFQTSKKHFSYSTDEELDNVVVVDIIEDAEEIKYTKGTISLHDSSECCSYNNHINQQKEKMQTNLFETMKHKQDDSSTTSNHHETNDNNNNNITGENIEMTDASTSDLNKVSIPSPPTRNISSQIGEENCENTSPHHQPDITTPPSAISTNQQYEKQSIIEETLVKPIHIEAFSIQPCYSRTTIKSPPQAAVTNPKHNKNEIRLEPPQRKFHHPLSISNSTNSSTNTTMSSIEEEEDEEAFSVYTLDGSLSNLNQDSSNHFNGQQHQTNNTSAIDFNSALNLLQSIRDEQSKTQATTLKPHELSMINQILLRNNISRKISKTITNHSKLETIQQQEEKNSKTTPKENHSPPPSIAAVTMKILNIAAFALLDISFVIGAALFVVGCALLIADNVNYFFSGILLFIIGSVLFLIGPLGKALVDIINLIRHFRWERKVKEITNLQNNSSKSITDQMHELHQDVTSYRPSDLPAMKMIILELVNDFFLIVGGLTFTIGSSLYMLNPPILIVIIAEVNWSVGAVSYLIVSIIQYIVKQVDIIKSARGGMDINPKCFTFMSIDLSAYLLNITSSLLFTIGSGCFLVNQRSLEIAGEVIWSLGCVAMIIAVICNRIIWIKSTWFERKDTLLTP